ncbi:polysaccharide deacetylase family protein [Simiduia agarivorans]|uniref:Polysaccharide deacetylase n=1 Tax=Simiduia agarivorans (strain DSM 21679 / JCM 13881 / BCRC 17597 / SA1) TaxID=1117647 RepID=K4KIU9_SIMAS|nr:polysaccharide deacetylase family protein [Simiduia agarivorans]AFU98956.1 polysaccharide deacetylase [Simiduia agarivorans SA1 = DSM 21679]
MRKIIPATKSVIKSALQAIGAVAFHATSSSDRDALTILMYHRVLPADDPRYAEEEPGMVVEPQTFDLHLEILSQHFEVIGLQSFLTDKTTKLSKKPKCAITFDDGWADNYQFAWPLLKKHRMPATIFLASDYIGTDLDFWPNQVNRLLKHARDAFLNAFTLDVDINPQLTEREFGSNLIRSLKRHTDKEIYRALDALPPNLQSLRRADVPGLMNWTQVMEMAQDPLIDFGSHTRKHYRLNLLNDETDLTSEIVLSRNDIEQKLGKPVLLFCYPNGNTSKQTEQLVMTHYTGAVTTENGKNPLPLASTHLLKRIAIHNDATRTKIAFKSRLSGLL